MVKKINFPKIKKKVNAFLVGEEGKISKESLIKAGTVIGFIGLGAALSSQKISAELHSNNLFLEYDTTQHTVRSTHVNNIDTTHVNSAPTPTPTKTPPPKHEDMMC